MASQKLRVVVIEDGAELDADTLMQITRTVDTIMQPFTENQDYFLNVEDEEDDDDGYLIYVACYTDWGRRIPVPVKCINDVMGRRFKVEGTRVELMFELMHSF